MQSADEDSQAKSRSVEENINFRRSPNFKNMKKYLKSKYEEIIKARESQREGASEKSAAGHDTLEKVNTPVQNALVQPPLLSNPPPSDTPPLLVNLKQEIEDDDYKQNEPPSEYNQTEELKTINIKTDQSEASEEPDVAMCRSFARGTCKRGAACIYAHEIILSQLPGVYTFCRDFQNKVCAFPECKYVHATVFEKEKFFRTGYLPPHTLAHLKEGAVALPPPPPPQPEVCSSPRDLLSGEPPAKKCKNCASNEFRLQLTQTEVDELKLENDQLKSILDKVVRNNAKLIIALLEKRNQ